MSSGSPMLDRHIAHCGTPPRQMAADGGYASRDNLNQVKCGVRDIPFHKKRGLAVADMAKGAWVYRKLRNFRAGIESRHLLRQARPRLRTLYLAWARPL